MWRICMHIEIAAFEGTGHKAKLNIINLVRKMGKEDKFIVHVHGLELYLMQTIRYGSHLVHNFHA